jgi:hypothetical protein
MVDFTAIANLANTILADLPGRSVTVIKLDDSVDDAAKPWRGASDARSTPAASSTQTAVFVPPTGSGLGSLVQQEELIKRSEQIMLIAPGAASSDDLSDFDEVIDTDGSRWKITFTEVLAPSDVTLLYAIGVRR